MHRYQEEERRDFLLDFDRKDGHIIRARCAPLSPASGFPVSWSQSRQRVIHEIFWLFIVPEIPVLGQIWPIFDNYTYLVNLLTWSYQESLRTRPEFHARKLRKFVSCLLRA